jgi:hypothetical protein
MKMTDAFARQYLLNSRGDETLKATMQIVPPRMMRTMQAP